MDTPIEQSPEAKQMQAEAEKKLREVEQALLQQTFDASQPTLVEAPQAPKPPMLSEIHKLKLENTSIKMLSLAQQMETLLKERARLSREFDVLRAECLTAYGVDVATTRINEDGTFGGPLPPNPAVPPMPRKA